MNKIPFKNMGMDKFSLLRDLGSIINPHIASWIAFKIEIIAGSEKEKNASTLAAAAVAAMILVEPLNPNDIWVCLFS